MIKTVRTLHGRFRALLSDRDGASAVEFALIAPLLMVLFMGAVGLGSWRGRTHRTSAMVDAPMATPAPSEQRAG